MGNNTATWQLFEDLARRILESNNFTVERHSPRGESGFDFIGRLDDELWAIEVKYYRTARAQPSLIEAAANRLIANGLTAQTAKGMLIMSCLLTPSLRTALEERFSVTFVDRVDLRNWRSRPRGS